jgi:hypothetical protein
MTPTPAMIAAGAKAGRKALDDYSTFDSGMVPDDALDTFVTAVLTAALALIKPPVKGPSS